jgi:hypothetical protein
MSSLFFFMYMTAMMTDMLEKVATEAVKVEAEAKPADDKKAASSKSVDERRFNVVTDSSRDALLTDFGKKTDGEDPVIHFYEHFLGIYNKKLK